MFQILKFSFTCFVVIVLAINSLTVQGQPAGDTTKELEPGESYAGILGKNQSFYFELEANDAILLTVSQPNADAVIYVFSHELNYKSEEIIQASLPDTSWLDETIFITGEQCQYCRVKIGPATAADEFGSFTLSSQEVSDWPSRPESKIYKLWTKASHQWRSGGDSKENLSRVLEFYHKAQEISGQSKLVPLMIQSQYMMSGLLHRLRDVFGQKQQLNSLLLIKGVENTPFYPLVLWDLAELLMIDKQLDDAKYYIERLSELANASGDPLLQAISFDLQASSFNVLGQFSEAEALFERVNDIYLATGNWRKSVEAKTSQGWFQYRMGELEQALHNYRSALAIATKTGLRESQIDLNTKIASIYRSRGEIDRATRYIDLALELSELRPLTRVAGWAKQEKARIFLETGLLESAKDVLKDSKLLFQNIKSERDVSNIDYFLAGTSQQLNDIPEAKKYLNLVLNYDLQRGSDYDIGTGYSRLAETALAQNDEELALQYQIQALDYLSKTDDSYLMGRQYSLTAEIYAKNQLYGKSKEYFELASKTQREVQDIFGQIKTGYRKAQMHRSKGDRTTALDVLSQTAIQIQQERQKISAQDLKKSFLALHQEIASLHITLMNETNVSAPESLLLSDSFRSKTLVDKFVTSISNTEAPPELLAKRKILEATLQKGVIDYQTLADEEHRQRVVKEARKTVSQLHTLDAQINQTQSSDGNVKSVFEKSLNIEDFQQQLSKDTVALYFHTSQWQSHLWIISHKEINQVVLPSEMELKTPVEQLLEMLGKRPLRGNRNSQIKPVIARISEMLFKNTQVAWGNVKNLIVIPDGPLNYLPFSVLQLPGTSTNFLENINLSYAPSLSVLMQLKDIKPLSNATEDILVVANPEFISKQEKRIPSGLRAGFSSHELPFTEKEIRAIQSTAKTSTKVLSRQEANKQHFLSLPLSTFNILHFATHGLANNYVPSLGGLVFSNAKSSDNLLLAPEITNLEFNAELVVLSACETGYGRLIKGEGLQGLSRSFFEAGSQRIIASLWSVQDDATAVLMESFYKHLLSYDKPVEEALRLAKLDVKNYQRKNRQKPWRDPFYWAGFVLQGPGGRISG